jgi:hypothetical protein
MPLQGHAGVYAFSLLAIVGSGLVLTDRSKMAFRPAGCDRGEKKTQGLESLRESPSPAEAAENDPDAVLG